MTRQDYLQKHWTRYPVLDGKTLSQGLSGRVVELEAGAVILACGTRVSFTKSLATQGRHPQLGQEVPVHLLQRGDIVFVLQDLAQIQFYLLSPCLSDPPTQRENTWALFLRTVEEFFVNQGFTCWPTPYLVTSPGVDAHIDFMQVSSVRTQRSFCLPTSPEIELKKVIVGGNNRVFEIKSCFRDDDPSPIHKTEFKMLEWYRAYANKWQLVDDVEQLILYATGQLGFPPAAPMERVSVAEMFQQFVGVNLTPQTTEEELLERVQYFQLDFAKDDDWDDLFFRLYIEKIEPQLNRENPVIIYNFPPSQSSIARLTEDGWADRFEIYWRGVELANAYQEQNDPEMVKQKVLSEMKKREVLGRKANPVDFDFLKVMEQGFPPCAGCALGLDRLFMVLQNKTSIY